MLCDQFVLTECCLEAGREPCICDKSPPAHAAAQVPELNVQNGVLKALSFLFEYIGEMGKDYIYAVSPLLEDALMDRDLVRGSAPPPVQAPHLFRLPTCFGTRLHTLPATCVVLLHCCLGLGVHAEGRDSSSVAVLTVQLWKLCDVCYMHRALELGCLRYSQPMS